jgi:hypothetical protein
MTILEQLTITAGKDKKQLAAQQMRGLALPFAVYESSVAFD